MRKMKWFRVGMVPVVAVLALPLMAGAASADTEDEVGTLGGCVGAICGSVMNESRHVIWAIKDYDANGPKPGTEWRALQPGQQTPSNQDWDGFYVECNASGRIATWTFPGYWLWRDFSMPAGYTLKVSTDQDAHVRSQSC